jgi:hypothetical protein
MLNLEAKMKLEVAISAALIIRATQVAALLIHNVFGFVEFNIKKRLS